MIQYRDVVGHFGGTHFRAVVLEEMLKMFEGKFGIEVVGLPESKRSVVTFGFISALSKKLNLNSIAWPTTCDMGAIYVISNLIKEDAKDLIKEAKPIEFLTRTSKFIKPLYLFLDEEVLLYAKLKKLKFKKVKIKKDEISLFVDGLEKKHPEVKRAIVNGWLGLES